MTSLKVPQPPSFVAQITGNPSARPQSSRVAPTAQRPVASSPTASSGRRQHSASPGRRPQPVDIDSNVRFGVWAAVKTLAEETLLTRRSVVIPGLGHFLIQEQRCDWGTWNKRHSYMPVFILEGGFVSSFRVRQVQTVPHAQLGSPAHTFLNISALSDRTGSSRDVVSDVIRQTVHSFGTACLSGNNAALDLNFVKLLVSDGVDEAGKGSRRLTILWKEDFVKNFEHVVGVEPDFPARSGDHAPKARDSFVLNKSLSVERTRPSPRRDQQRQEDLLNSVIQANNNALYDMPPTSSITEGNSNVPSPANQPIPPNMLKKSVPQPPVAPQPLLDTANFNNTAATTSKDFNGTQHSRCTHDSFDDNCPDDLSPHRRHKLHKLYVRRQRGLCGTFDKAWTDQQSEHLSLKQTLSDQGKAERVALDETIREGIANEKAALAKRRDIAKQVELDNLQMVEGYRASKLPRSETLGMLLPEADKTKLNKYNTSPRMMIEPRKQNAIPIYPPISHQSIHDVTALAEQVNEAKQKRAKAVEDDRAEGKRLEDDARTYFHEELVKREKRMQRNVEFFEINANSPRVNQTKEAENKAQNAQFLLSSRDAPDFMGKKLGEAKVRHEAKAARIDKEKDDIRKYRLAKVDDLARTAITDRETAENCEAQVAASCKLRDTEESRKRETQQKYRSELEKQIKEKSLRDKTRRNEETSFTPYAVLRNDSSDDED